MKDRVEKFIHEENLMQQESDIVVAVSGGVDSMVLLHLLEELKEKWSWNLFVLHVNHQLRGEESEQDANFIEAYCLQFHIPYNETRIDVTQLKANEKLSTQVAARELRYKAFKEEMDRVNAKVLVTAHHGDDEIETVFMRLNRGKSPFTRLGIAPKRNFSGKTIVRPLLQESRESIMHYSLTNSVPFREDSSNASNTYARNRFRHNVSSYLKEENRLNYKHIFQYDRWQNEDNEYLMTLATQKFDDILIERKGDSITISKERFHETAIPLQRRVIHLILNYLYGITVLRDFSVYINQIEQFFQFNSGFAQIDLRDDLKVMRLNDVYRFTLGTTVESVEYCSKLSVPGKLDTPIGTIKIGRFEGISERSESEVFLNMNEVVFPLYIRNRRPGDRLNPKGLNGASKKVNRVFIDKKVDWPLRDRWPILVDHNDTILWIPLLLQTELTTPFNSSDPLLRVAFTKERNL
ncbi:tRNA(Ile)-lysidine synthetase [Bacillus sp. JCM 19046]|nr:tRNA(Ile)-lysidine synthetase [Bacillus sp. JCM 19045]GAF17673.1 tRNA(Ile)-lysidine synthetase [Bacillus sp. JCM 19046]